VWEEALGKLKNIERPRTGIFPGVKVRPAFVPIV
jgi:hypothetical protein